MSSTVLEMQCMRTYAYGLSSLGGASCKVHSLGRSFIDENLYFKGELSPKNKYG